MINSFKKEYAFLSNFYKCKVIWGGIEYPSSEHAYQACKFKDNVIRFGIANCGGPGNSKKLANGLYINVIRKDWHEIKEKVMKNLLMEKFTQNPELAELLISTYPEELIEGNTWNDTFWGVCEGVGENKLGIALMDVRQILKGE